MPLVADAAVKVAADMSRFASDVRAGGERAIQGLGQQLKSVFSPRNLAVAGVAGGVALAGAITAGLAGAAKALIDIERLNAQTDAAIKSTGGVANVTRAEVEELGESMESLTTIERETVQEAANMLLTFTKVRNEVGAGNDIFDQATESALNMSVALGTDAKSAAMLLGKALNDPVKGMTAMTRAGIQFTDQQKEMIAAMVESGDMLGAQKIILAELETQFGGSAEAFANTTAGKIQRFQNDIGNMFESIVLGAVEVSDSLGREFELLGMEFGDMGDRSNALADRMGIDFNKLKEHVSFEMRETGRTWEEVMQGMEEDTEAAARRIEAGTTAMTDAQWDAVEESGLAWQTYQSQLRGGAGDVDAASRDMADGIPKAMQDALDEGEKIARSTPGSLANQLREGIDDYDEALEELTEVAVNSVSDLAERQKIEGILASEELTNALNSDSTRTRLLAQELVADLVSDYELLAPGAMGAGELVNPALKTGLTSNLILAKQGGEAIRDAAGNPLVDTSWAGEGGENIGTAWALGLKRARWAAQEAARELAGEAYQYLHGRSPPQEGPLKHIDDGGRNVGRAWAGGLGAAAPWAALESRQLAGTAADVLTGSIPTPGLGVAAGSIPAAAAGAQRVFNLYVNGVQRTVSTEQEAIQALVDMGAFSEGRLSG